MKVRGTMKTVKPLEIVGDNVCVRKNIIKVEDEEFSGWEYDEESISLEEYLQTIEVLGQQVTNILLKG